MAKKVLDEKPKEKATKVAKDIAPSKEEAEIALEEVAKEEKISEDSIKPKSNRKKIICGIVACVVVAVIACVCFFGYRILFGSNPVKISSDAIRELKDIFADAKDETSEVAKIIEGKDPYEISSKMNINLPQGMGKFALNLLMQADSQNNKARFDLSAKEDKNEILNLNAALDDTKLYFKLADTMKNYYFVDIAKVADEFKSKVKEATNKVDPELVKSIMNYDYTKLIDYLADAVDDNLSKNDFKKSKETITINDKDVKATKYTTKINEEKALAILKGFANKAIDDKDIIKMISKATDTKESEVKDKLKEAIKNIKASGRDEYINYSVYVSSLGSTLGYGFEVEDKKSDATMGIIIGTKNDVTTIEIRSGQYSGYVNINTKDDDNIKITLNILGMITGEMNIKSDFDTVKKNQEYKETTDVDFSLSAMGQNVKASLSSESTIKKINKVEIPNVAGAINLEKMTSEEEYRFMNEVKKSSFYKLIENLSAASPIGGGAIENEFKAENDPKKSAFVDTALNVAKAAETKYIAESNINGKNESVCYTISDLKDYATLNGYEGKVEIDKYDNDTIKKVYLSDGKYMILGNDSSYLNEYSVFDYSTTLWDSSYSTCK